MQVNSIDYDEMFQARKKLQAIADAWNELGMLGQARVVSHAMELSGATRGALIEGNGEGEDGR